MTGAAALVATQGADAVAAARLRGAGTGRPGEEEELVVPVDGVGDDTDATMEGTVSAWRSVTAEDLAAAIDGTEQPTRRAVLSTRQSCGDRMMKSLRRARSWGRSPDR